MRIDELYPSRFLKATDLQGKPQLHTIEGISVEEFDDDESKPLLKLKGTKGLILNRTNANIIATFLGEDTNTWLGKQIVIYTAKVEFRGRLVDSIRVREPKMPAAAVGSTPPPPPAPPAPRSTRPLPAQDDDVPF